MVGGSFFPSALDALLYGIENLDDNVYEINGYNYGAQTASAKFTSIQVQLDRVYSDISHIRIWAGDVTKSSSSGFLTIWLSNGTNVTTTGTRCASGVNIMAGQDGVVTCPAVSNVLYVTIERNDPITADNLVINELHVYRSSMWGNRHLCGVRCSIHTCMHHSMLLVVVSSCRCPALDASLLLVGSDTTMRVPVSPCAAHICSVPEQYNGACPQR